jgi:hypothetical protein
VPRLLPQLWSPATVRGAVLHIRGAAPAGAMLYGAAYWPIAEQDELSKMGFDGARDGVPLRCGCRGAARDP